MKKTVITTVMIALLFLMPMIPARASEPGLIDSYRMSSEIKEGNRKYKEEKYDRARASYTQAKDRAPEESEGSYSLHYNLGATFYKDGNYEKARKEFEKALRSSDPGMREKAHYNLGNTYFKEGKKAGEVKLLEKAVGEYRKALEINPDNRKAKHNIEVVRRIIDLEKKRKQNQSGSDSKKGSEDKEEQQSSESSGGEGAKKKEGDEKKKSSQSSQKDKTEKAPAQKEQEKDKPQQAGSSRKEKDSERKQAAQSRKEEKRKKQEQKPAPAGGDTVRAGEKRDQKASPAGSKEDKGRMNKKKALQLLQAVEKREKEDMKRVMESRRERTRKARDW
ncbi:MAG: tetratricopeptide repeat protein [bacterium]